MLEGTALKKKKRKEEKKKKEETKRISLESISLRHKREG